MLQSIAIKDIVQDPDRHRHVGDIDQLVASIRQVGLLQPVVVTANRKLVAGARRIEAHCRLGRKTILCRIVENLDEALPHLLAEMTENTCRKSFAPSEAVHAAEQLMPLAATRRDLDYIPPSLTEARIQGYSGAM
jgi:ParB family transcriptional regulator, chromosome partitioning protein